ncbi:helix-turn-helix domain-containing protein [Candidatus Daviesbacteria bacterium]|nr:helix-turn-helix domain-containing protein [Candidatus Daviesbacteria bacterium]
MSKWEDLEKELLADPAVKKEYDHLALRYTIISELIALRLKKGMTQKDIAEKIGTKQSAIARLESGSINPSIEFLHRIAQVMGYKLSIHLSR